MFQFFFLLPSKSPLPPFPLNLVYFYFPMHHRVVAESRGERGPAREIIAPHYNSSLSPGDEERRGDNRRGAGMRAEERRWVTREDSPLMSSNLREKSSKGVVQYVVIDSMCKLLHECLVYLRSWCHIYDFIFCRNAGQSPELISVYNQSISYVILSNVSVKKK